jgi:hypothetical protein
MQESRLSSRKSTARVREPKIILLGESGRIKTSRSGEDLFDEIFYGHASQPRIRSNHRRGLLQEDDREERFRQIASAVLGHGRPREVQVYEHSTYKRFDHVKL